MNNKFLKKICALIFALAICICACGCGMTKSEEAYDMAMPQDYVAGMTGNGKYMADNSVALKTDAAESVKSTNLIQDSIGSLGKENLKLVYTASMDLQTTDYEKAEEGLTELVKKFDGYFESINASNEGMFSTYSYRSGYYVVRVPAEKYTDFINSVGDVYHVVNISQNVQDIGQQYFEVEARLETLKTKRDRLNELLKKAANLTDIIQLETELSNTEYEIDQYTTTLNHYDSLVGYSTVNISVSEVTRPDDGVTTDNSFAARLGRAFKRGLTNTATALENFVLWAARNVIGIIIFAVIVILLIKFRPIKKWIDRSEKKKDKKEE